MQSIRALDILRPFVPRVYVPTFILSVGKGMLVPTLPLFVAALVRDPVTMDVNFTLVTIAVAAASLGTLFCDIPAGLLLTRISERTGHILGLAVIAATIALLALDLPYTLLIVLRLLTGAGLSVWGLSRMQYMLRMTPSHQRGRIMSIFGGVNRIGTFASPAAGGAIATIYGFETLFVIAGLVIAAGLVPTLLSPEATPPRPETTDPNLATGLTDMLRRHRHDLLTAGSGQLLVQGIRSGRQVVLPLFAAFALDLDAAAVGIVISTSAAIDMVLFPLAGYVMDRYGRKFAIIPSFTLFSLAMALLPAAQDLTGLILIGLLIGFANGIGSGSMLTLGTDLAPAHRPSQFLGVWRVIGGIGDTGGPVVVGAVADIIGLLMAPFFLAGVGLAGAGTFGFLVRETLVKQPLANTNGTEHRVDT
ncbi:MAG TPA: MFS transporter [Chloroflexi bacterium]|mgnify:CR=1 FL=1|nr:MFS transporter [Chloroflexota bacterium]